MRVFASKAALLGIGGLLLLIACDDDSSTATGPVDEQVIDRSFAAKESLSMEAVSGDFTVKAANDDSIRVHLEYAYRPIGSFEPTFAEEGDKLVLREHFNSGSSNGHGTWTVTVPAQTRLRFSSASGDLDVEASNEIEASAASGDISLEGSSGEVRVTTASGDAELEEVSGTITISTASGDIEAKSLSGELTASTASGRIELSSLTGEITATAASGRVRINRATGSLEIVAASADVDVSQLVLTGESSFVSASGDVEVSLAATAEHDLTLTSASGDAVLDCNGNEVRGQYVFTAQVYEGEIDSPFAFDLEEEFTQVRTTYDRKSFTRMRDTPVVKINTASGTARLKE